MDLPVVDDVQDVLRSEREAIALGVALDADADLRAHEARELSAEVYLRHDDALRVGDEVGGLLGRERPEHARIERADGPALLAQAVHRLPHRPVGGAEADDRDLGPLLAVELMAGQAVLEWLELGPALGLHAGV